MKIFRIVARDYTVSRLYLANYKNRTLSTIWTNKLEYAKAFDSETHAHIFADEIGLARSTYDIVEGIRNAPDVY